MLRWWRLHLACMVAALLRFKVALRYGVLVLPVLLGVVVVAYSLDWIPEQTVERLMRFELEGSESRAMLVLAGVDSLIEHPLAKYWHTMMSSPPTLSMRITRCCNLSWSAGSCHCCHFWASVFAATTAWRLRSQPFGAALLVYGAVVAAHSLSSGDAYVAQVWFFVFFLATLRLPRQR